MDLVQSLQGNEAKESGIRRNGMDDIDGVEEEKGASARYQARGKRKTPVEGLHICGRKQWHGRYSGRTGAQRRAT
jgi:hypothetical protein